MITTLDKVSVNSYCVLHQINADENVKNRLFSLGLCVCDKIHIEGKTLFNSVIIFSIMNYPEKIKIAIKQEDAKQIMVKII